MVFQPNASSFKVSPKICICETYKQNYGSCSNFEERIQQVQHLTTPYLRSQEQEEEDSMDDVEDGDDEDEVDSWDFLQPGSFVAVKAERQSKDEFWIIKINKNDCVGETETLDDYGWQIIEGLRYLTGNFLERKFSERKYVMYSLSQQETFFYKESVFYPFVHVQETKQGLKITNEHLSDIIAHSHNCDFTPT